MTNMTRPGPRLAALAALLALAACPKYSPRAPAAGSSDCAPGATGPRAFDAIAYDLTASYDWEVQALAATLDVTLAICPGGSALVSLDAAAPVTVTAVRAGAKGLPYQRVGDELRVDLSSLSPGVEPVRFRIEYQALPSDAMAGVRSGWEDDPVQSRLVLTDSEPDRARQWLPSKDDPADRALFSVEIAVPEGEDVVSNGERLSDVTAGGVRRVRYALDVPLPTYLMAFAAGELEHEERILAPRPDPGGRPALPIALWWRRGLAVEPAQQLDAIEEAMEVFEDRLGPYPFSRYAVVLVPNGGGMENATITFDHEWSGQGPVSFGLNAHELAHHWFGDWVTMRTYDDVWVKEGMATLLAAEAERAFRDAEGRGRLFGRDFRFDPDDAILDTSLTGLAKYTSGPYERAAALMTQLRAMVGEEAFWGRCRGFLAAHAAGSATGEDFVRAFSPDLDEATIQHVLGLLPQKAVPSFTASSGTVGGGLQASFLLEDPGGILLVPPTVSVVDDAPVGTVLELSLPPGVPRDAPVPVGGYVAVDEREVHWDVPDLEPVVPAAPAGPAAARFLSRSAAHQEDVAFAWPWTFTAAELPGALAGLDSSWARAVALGAACSAHGGAVPASLFETPPERWPLSGRLAYRTFLPCGSELGATFEAELVERANRMALSDLKRLEYLLSFRYGTAGRAAIEQVAAEAPSRRLRYYATQRLGWDATGLQAGATPAREDRAGVRTLEGKATGRGAAR
jgi:hypothetical protein